MIQFTDFLKSGEEKHLELPPFRQTEMTSFIGSSEFDTDENVSPDQIKFPMTLSQLRNQIKNEQSPETVLLKNVSLLPRTLVVPNSSY